MIVFLAAGAGAWAQPTSKVMVAAAQVKELPASSVLVGTVRPNRSSVVGAEVAGLVAELPVRQGDLLKQGDLICRINADIAELELRAAERRLEALRAGVEVADADLERWRLEKERIMRLSEENKANVKELYDVAAEFSIARNRVTESRQSVAEQEAVVDLKKTEIAKTRVQAPFDGYVTELLTEVGQWLGRGSAVVAMVDLESVLVRVAAPESATPHVVVGAEARVRVDAVNEVLKGRVKHIVPQSHDQSRTFPVDVEIPNPEHRLRGGMFARTTLQTGAAMATLAVPKDAVVQRGGLSQVWKIQPAGPQGKLAVPVYVMLGSEVGEWIAVTTGDLAAGTEVVIRGNERLMPFPSPVEIVQEEALMTGGMAEAQEAASAAPEEVK